MKTNFLQIWRVQADERGFWSHLVAGDEILCGSESNYLENDNADELKRGGNCMSQNPAGIFSLGEEKLEIDDCRFSKMEEFRGVHVSGSDMKERREKLLEDAMESAPEVGFGRVKHLVKAFEKIGSIPRSKETEDNDEKVTETTKKNLKKWILTGFLPSFIASRWMTDGVERRTLGRRKLKSTSVKPFNLRTERRGDIKKEEFINKVEKMMEEDKKHRISLAKGLPWTTDEPERLMKPPVKQRTAPIDLVLHSAIRAKERAKFDHQVSEKKRDYEQLSLKMKEKPQKLVGEERIGRHGTQSTSSSDRQWISTKKRRLISTTLKPFNLRTEKRGSSKKEEFIKKVQKRMEEEQQHRIPLARLLPWTTYQPERMVKPPVKQKTRPIDPVLHNDIRAKGRAEFDRLVAEKMSLIEEYRKERERQRKLAEEEEIRSLRKELVPRAQPLPYFYRTTKLGLYGQ